MQEVTGSWRRMIGRRRLATNAATLSGNGPASRSKPLGVINARGALLALQEGSEYKEPLLRDGTMGLETLSVTVTHDGQ